MSGFTIVHASDIHFGKPHHPEAAEAFLQAAREIGPDLLVFSGDFTQRAKVREFRAARAYLNRFPQVPSILVPGNHDVPLYRVLERIFIPFRNYRAYIQKELDTVTRIPGATVVALNTADPHRSIVNGRIRAHQIAFAERAFAGATPGDLRILVAHHHLASPKDEEKDAPIPGASEHLGHFARMGVDLILGGHLHRGYTSTSLNVRRGIRDEREVLIVQSGTTSSGRGRAGEKGIRSFNRLRVEEDRIELTPYRHLAGEAEFTPLETRTFPRAAAKPVER